MRAALANWRARWSGRVPPPPGPRPFVTPEGVDLRLAVGLYTDRMSAFILDALIIIGLLIAISLLAMFGAWGFHRGSIGTEGALVIWLLGAFLLRNFYFIGFELRPGAATPGKRALGLRVIARDGGRLTADAVFARNAMRELEIFLPASFFLARGMGVDAGLIALGAIWSGVFVVFPLFNRDRLRLGDLAAGTMVIKVPKTTLRPELVQEGPATVRGVAFSEAQIDAYGIKELHVLEQVLRTGDRRTLAEVARRIRTKIAWDGPMDVTDRAFLSSYYAALRGRLESRALFGHRRQDKFDRV
ncbi:MAG: RDD family protein [Phenylobacterium sp.]|nr:MAG: RDD family protein [Phenylobacterium sp.]